MAILRRKKTSTSKNEVEIENKESKTTGIQIDEVKPVKRKIIKKGSKVVANGRCFGSASLECPLKAVRNYETKILDINKKNNSVLIDEGWINKDFVK